MPGIDECLLEVMTLPGALGAAVVDWTSGLALGTVGDSPTGDHETTCAETAEVARLAAEQTAFAAARPGPPARPKPPAEPHRPDTGRAGEGAPVEDVIITTRTGYHLLRYVETQFDSSIFLHLWLDRGEGNLALARMRLQDLAERLVLA